jgi:hypothetical protein
MLSREAALVYAMVCAAGSGREIAQEEIGIIGDLVDHLPIFHGIERRQVRELATRCSAQLAGPGGMDAVYGQIRGALAGRLREAAYALSCDVIAVCRPQQDTQRLERVRAQLGVDPAMARTIERAARLRSKELDAVMPAMPDRA